MKMPAWLCPPRASTQPDPAAVRHVGDSWSAADEDEIVIVKRRYNKFLGVDIDAIHYKRQKSR